MLLSCARVTRSIDLGTTIWQQRLYYTQTRLSLSLSLSHKDEKWPARASGLSERERAVAAREIRIAAAEIFTRAGIDERMLHASIYACARAYSPCRCSGYSFFLRVRRSACSLCLLREVCAVVCVSLPIADAVCPQCGLLFENFAFINDAL